jgi:hypothetical protein
MRVRSCVGVLAAFFCAALAGTAASTEQQSGADYAGQWTGTWDGSGSGNFELTLEKAKDRGESCGHDRTGQLHGGLENRVVHRQQDDRHLRLPSRPQC